MSLPLRPMSQEQDPRVLLVAATLAQTEIQYRGGPISTAEVDVRQTFVKYAEWLLTYKRGDPA